MAFLGIAEEMSKKMCPRKSSLSTIYIIGYSIPVYHETTKSYVDFYAVDPNTGRARRKKYHLDSIDGKRARHQYAKQLIRELTAKLAGGWRPWAATVAAEEAEEAEPERILIRDSFAKYIDRIKRGGRQKTIRTYQTAVNIINEYFTTLKRPPRYIDELTTGLINDFLDWTVETRGVVPRTRNNYRNWLAGYCEWLRKRKEIDENPVENVERIKEQPKQRRSLTPEMLKRLFEYLKQHDPDFLLAVMMEYYTFIRPNELGQIRLRDISIKEQRIFIAANISKNNRDGYVALNETIILQMIENKIFEAEADSYLFGRDFRPAKERAPYNTFNNRWRAVKKELHWGDEYQFYSLKDSGIRDLANAEGIVTARNQARHTDISTTNKYIEGGCGVAPEGAKHFKGNLG